MQVAVSASFLATGLQTEMEEQERADKEALATRLREREAPNTHHRHPHRGPDQAARMRGMAGMSRMAGVRAPSSCSDGSTRMPTVHIGMSSIHGCAFRSQELEAARMAHRARVYALNRLLHKVHIHQMLCALCCRSLGCRLLCSIAAMTG